MLRLEFIPKEPKRAGISSAEPGTHTGNEGLWQSDVIRAGDLYLRVAYNDQIAAGVPVTSI